MNSVVLIVHLVVGILVALSAAFFVWQRVGRRITLYVLTVQILLGVWLMVGLTQAGIPVPHHYELGLLSWIGYMAANGMSRREGTEQAVRWITIGSSVCAIVALALGWYGVNHG
jgi:hypothetical protein